MHFYHDHLLPLLQHLTPRWTEAAIGFPPGAVVGGIVWIFGGFGDLIKTLILLVVVDFVFGVVLAWQQHRLSSNELTRGLVKKVGYFAAIIVASAAHRLFPPVMIADVPFSIRTLLMWGLIGAEMLSIVENLVLAGVPLPDWFVVRLKKIAEDSGRIEERAPLVMSEEQREATK